MKKKLAVLGSLLALAPLALATNGDNLIGIGPASRGMGGIGTGMPVGPIDSIFRNPGWLPYYNTKKFFVSFGGILFMPTVKVSSRGAIEVPADGGGYTIQPTSTNGRVKSRADTFMVPEVGIVYKINEKLAFGIGAFGVSGMGVDFRDKTNALAQMHTTFQFMRLTPTIAYKINEMISIGAALHIAWGSLDVGARLCMDTNGNYIPEADKCWNASGGQSQDFGIGASVGIALNFGDFIYGGLYYQTPVSMTYKNVFNSDNDMLDSNNHYEDMKLQQPQEVAVGVGVKPLENLKLGLDIRWIDWSGADGYGDFDWEDQWVFAVGVEYKPLDNLALRAGWNYGKTPIRSKDNLPVNDQNRIPNFAAPFSTYYVYWFNLVGFPAIAEHHLTLGLNWKVTPNFDIDLSYVYALSNTETATSVGGGAEVSAKMYQHSIGIGLNWSF